MPKFISCREFLEKKQKQKRYQNCLVRMFEIISCREFLERKQKQKKYQNCLVRMFDRDEYEHMSFRLREDTDFDNFNNVYDQDLLDSCVYGYFIFKDEDGITICLNGDIEL